MYIHQPSSHVHQSGYNWIKGVSSHRYFMKISRFDSTTVCGSMSHAHTYVLLYSTSYVHSHGGWRGTESIISATRDTYLKITLRSHHHTDGMLGIKWLVSCAVIPYMGMQLHTYTPTYVCPSAQYTIQEIRTSIIRVIHMYWLHDIHTAPATHTWIVNKRGYGY